MSSTFGESSEWLWRSPNCAQGSKGKIVEGHVSEIQDVHLDWAEDVWTKAPVVPLSSAPDARSNSSADNSSFRLRSTVSTSLVDRYGWPSRQMTASSPTSTSGRGATAAITGIAYTSRSMASPTRSTNGADSALPDTRPGLGWIPLLEDLAAAVRRGVTRASVVRARDRAGDSTGGAGSARTRGRRSARSHCSPVHMRRDRRR